jgi:hypothetical protein
MPRFETRLVAGKKAPYTSWTFVVVPEAVLVKWKKSRVDVRGTIDGEPFRGTVARGEDVYRMPVKKELLEKIGASRGDLVQVRMEPDREPRTVTVPAELTALFRADPALAKAFEALPPSLQRAWASHVAQAKRPETRARRVQRAPEGIRKRVFP